MNELHLEFKKATGKMPYNDTVLDLIDDELIPDYYLIYKNDVNQISDGNELVVTCNKEYVNFLEEKINELKKQIPQ